MALKLFLISFILIFLLGVSQINPESRNLRLAKVLNQASENDRIKFFRISFKSFDANKDGFVTSNEFDNVDFDLGFDFDYLASEAMTEAFIHKNENGVDPTKIGITFEDYKDALKKRLEQICGIS